MQCKVTLLDYTDYTIDVEVRKWRKLSRCGCSLAPVMYLFAPLCQFSCFFYTCTKWKCYNLGQARISKENSATLFINYTDSNWSYLLSIKAVSENHVKMTRFKLDRLLSGSRCWLPVLCVMLSLCLCGPPLILTAQTQKVWMRLWYFMSSSPHWLAHFSKDAF